MKVIAFVGFALSLAAQARAVTATGLSSFDGREEPLVKYFPATGKFERDSFLNITDQGGGTFRFFLRYNATWWDGDRDTQNKDRQRAEVKGLGPHQKHGDTFDYATTWRASAGFRATAGFCHIFQLKAINGDSGAPLITLSLRGEKATVEANSVGPKIIAREFPWEPDAWQTVRIRVKTTPDAEGELLVSVDGDEPQGKKGVVLIRPGADEYRPKWGLYRRAAVGVELGDDYIEHRDVSAQNVLWTGGDNSLLERRARALAKNSPPLDALRWLLAQPASGARDFAIGSIAALWAETDPAAAMAWAETLPAGALRRDVTPRIFSRWDERDVKAALAWLRTHAPHRDLDRIVWLFVTDTTYRYVQRERALEAVSLLTDSSLRVLALLHVAEIWARDHAKAARAYVQSTAAISPDEKIAILKKLPLPSGPSPSISTTTSGNGLANPAQR